MVLLIRLLLGALEGLLFVIGCDGGGGGGAVVVVMVVVVVVAVGAAVVAVAVEGEEKNKRVSWATDVLDTNEVGLSAGGSVVGLYGWELMFGRSAVERELVKGVVVCWTVLAEAPKEPTRSTSGEAVAAAGTLSLTCPIVVGGAGVVV